MAALTKTTSSYFDEDFYPESDGLPMADNTEQYKWIVTIKENLDVLLPAAFVAGDLLWYPVQGNRDTKQAPDVLVAIGRPKGKRGSYKQWEEENVAPQVVFEILSPGNRHMEMLKKEHFYQRYGVQEYYVYDPETNEIEGWTQKNGSVTPIADFTQWKSPLLGIWFEVTPETLRIFRPDGKRFETFLELSQRVEQAEAAIEAERRKSEALAQKLRELGIDPESLG